MQYLLTKALIMKNLLKITRIIIALITFIFISCNKEDVPDKVPVQESTCYVTKVSKGEYHSEEFFYDANNRLQKIRTIEGYMQDTFTYDLVYDNKGKVVKALQDEKGIAYIAFYYNVDNTISSAEMVFSNANQGLPYRVTNFKYNSNKKIIRATINSGPNSLGDYIYFDYFYDTKGNIITEKYYTIDQTTKDWKLSSTITSKYDESKNPYHEIKMPPLDYRYYSFSKNNAVYQNTQSENSNWELKATIKYTPENYPQSIRFKDQDGNYTHTVAYTYNCVK